MAIKINNILIKSISGKIKKINSNYLLSIAATELINAEPVFTSTPILTINQGQLYSYSVTVSDDNSGDINKV